MRKLAIMLILLFAVLSINPAVAEVHEVETYVDGVCRYASNEPDGDAIYFYCDVEKARHILFKVISEIQGTFGVHKISDWSGSAYFSIGGSSANPNTYYSKQFLNPGRYRISVYADSLSTGRVGLTLEALPTRLTEIEPNDVYTQAQRIEMEQTVYAGLGQPRDIDFYAVDVGQAGKYTLEVGGYVYQLDYATYTSDGFLIESGKVDVNGSDTKLGKGQTAFALPEGRAYISLGGDFFQSTDGFFYNFKLAAPPKSDSFAIPAGQKVTRGFEAKMTVTPKPEGASLPSLYWESSNPSIATVDENGVVAGHSVGNVKITCSDGAGTSASGVLTVRENRFSRSKPLPYPEREVYASTKKLEYKGGYLNAEVFIVNRTKYALYIKDNMQVSVRQLMDQREYIAHSRIIPIWDTGLYIMKPGARKVLKVRFPAGSVCEMDLALGTCEAAVSGFAIARGRGARFEIKNARAGDKKL